MWQIIAGWINWPVWQVQIAATILVIILMPLVKIAFTRFVIGWLDDFTKKTEGDLDDQLIAIIKKPINWLSVTLTLWLIVLIFRDYLSPAGAETAIGIIGLFAIIIVAIIIWDASPILGQLLEQLTSETENELDDLLAPYMSWVFKGLAIIVIASKAAEVFFGASSGALFGIFGGASVGLSLLLRDILYDWLCAIIVYTGQIYKKGDYIGMPGIGTGGGFGYGMIVEIGLRTTTVYVSPWRTIVKVPNSEMVTAKIENWSQNIGDHKEHKHKYEGESTLEWGFQIDFEVDGISADKSIKLCDALEEMVKTDVRGISKRSNVRFKNIQGNARVFQVRVRINDASSYFAAEKDVNLGILRVLEKEGIDTLSVLLRTDPQSFREGMKAGEMN